MGRRALAATKLEDGRPAYALGPMLYAWRTEHGLSAAALAEAWGISVAEQRSIETRRMPSPSPAGTRYRDLAALLLAVEARGGPIDAASTRDRLRALYGLHDEDRKVHGTLPSSAFRTMAQVFIDEHDDR